MVGIAVFNKVNMDATNSSENTLNGRRKVCNFLVQVCGIRWYKAGFGIKDDNKRAAVVGVAILGFW